MKLPKPYLSYSAITLFLSNKSAYRRRYYENEKLPETPEMRFGKVIHRLIENNDPSVAHVPRHSVSEQKIETVIAGVPIMGYIDSFEPTTGAFREYKTGRTRRDGGAPWDRVKVHAHGQLSFYSLLIKEAYGTVTSLTHLDWIETEKKYKSTEFDGMVLEGNTYELQLTGRVETFERKIAEWERKRWEKIIKETALEISTDYEQWLLDKKS